MFLILCIPPLEKACCLFIPLSSYLREIAVGLHRKLPHSRCNAGAKSPRAVKQPERRVVRRTQSSLPRRCPRQHFARIHRGETQLLKIAKHQIVGRFSRDARISLVAPAPSPTPPALLPRDPAGSDTSFPYSRVSIAPSPEVSNTSKMRSSSSSETLLEQEQTQWASAAAAAEAEDTRKR